MSLSFRRLLGKSVYKNLLQIFFNSTFIASKTAFVLDLMGTLALIGITLAILAAFVLKNAKDLLVGQSASQEIENKIKSTVEALDDVNKVIELRTLPIGTGALMVDIEVNLQDGLTTDKIEVLIDRIKVDIIKQVPEAKEVRVELETSKVKSILS